MYLLDDTGRPAAADELTLDLSNPARGINPLSREPLPAGPGHWVVQTTVPFPGTWQLAIGARLSKYQRLTTTVPVTVNP